MQKSKLSKSGLYIILLLPIIGELYRLPFGTETGLLVSDVIIPLFLFFWVAGNIFSARPKLKTALKRAARPAFILPLALFFLIALLSLLYALTVLSISEVLVSAFYLFRLGAYIALYIIAINLVDTEKIRRRIFYVIAFSAFVLAIAGFIQLQIFPDLTGLEEMGWDPHINRLVSTWLDPNFLGGFFAFVVSVSLGILLYAKSTKAKLLLGLLILMLTAALFLTYSRSAYLALIAGIFIVSIFRSRKIVIIALVVLLVGLGVSERAQQRVSEMLTSINSIFLETADTPDPTTKLRLESWRNTIGLIGEKPILGHGYNTLRFVTYKRGIYASPELHAAGGSDSSLLTIFATTGILGLGAFLWMLASIIKQCFLGWRNKKLSPYLNGYSLGMLGGISALLVHSIFVNSLLYPLILIPFWVCVGLLKPYPKL
jgi:putative inorganic carbon (HCO3(-)) transporter